MTSNMKEFNSYEVDVKKKQFKKLGENNQVLEIIEFNSNEGAAMLREFFDSLDLRDSQDVKMLKAILR